VFSYPAAMFRLCMSMQDIIQSVQTVGEKAAYMVVSFSTLLVTCWIDLNALW